MFFSSVGPAVAKGRRMGMKYEISYAHRSSSVRHP
jgi:hypothetical protein